METGVFGDRNKVIQDLFSGLYSVNPKAKMVSVNSLHFGYALSASRCMPPFMTAAF